MSLKSAIKRMEKQIGMSEDEGEVVIYGFPNEDGTVGVLHVFNHRANKKETISAEEYDRRMAKRESETGRPLLNRAGE